DDGAVVISTTGTAVNGGGQDAAGGTLTVVDATNFPSSGSFTGKKLTGTCSYASKTGTTQLNGITGCTGTPDDGTTLTFVRKPGVYKWNGSDWILQTQPIGHGAEFPGSPGNGDLFRLAEHEIIAEAGAGAGKTDVGIAGAAAINIVLNDHTEAVVKA